jgi:hypothetical protein
MLRPIQRIAHRRAAQGVNVVQRRDDEADVRSGEILIIAPVTSCHSSLLRQSKLNNNYQASTRFAVLIIPTSPPGRDPDRHNHAD